MSAAALLTSKPKPSDADIDEASGNICCCGTYQRSVLQSIVPRAGIVCAVDCGIAINRDTIAAQVEGGTLFGLTAALHGNITLKNGRVEQSNFHDYLRYELTDRRASRHIW